MDGDKNLPEVIEKADVPIVNGQFAPTSFDGLWRVATMLASTNMVPKDYRGQPADIMVAVQMGGEVGMGYMASLQNIAVVRGKPTVYADGITALIQRKGILEWMEEGFRIKIGENEDGTTKYKEIDPSELPVNLDEWPDGLTAWCRMKRKGQEKIYKGSFSVADAKRIDKWNKATNSGKKSIWQQWPARMMTWRARTFPSRDGFSDVLKGFSIYEEVIDYDADMVESNGHYKIEDKGAKDIPESYFKKFVEDNKLDRDLVNKYIAESAEMIGCSTTDLVQGALDNPATFLERFKPWAEKNSGSPEAKSEPQTEKMCQNCDVPGCTGCKTVEIQEDSPPETEASTSGEDPCISEYGVPDDLLQIMYAELDRVDAPTNPQYEKKLSEYIDYIVGHTSQERDAVINTLTASNSWVEFFLGWLQEDESATAGDEPGREEPGEEMAGLPAEDGSGADGDAVPQETPAQPDDSVRDAIEPPDTDESAPPSEKKSFRKQWIGKPGKAFKPFVLQNPGKFNPNIISEEEYNEAVNKWKTLVQARTNEPWPYGEDQPEEQKEIRFPDKNNKQILRTMQQDSPDIVEKVIQKRKFARGALSEEAAGIVVKDVLEIMGGKVLK